MILQEIQNKLKAPKNQLNNFGGYRYRSCEDILESLKPILAEFGCAIILTDDILNISNRFYVKATATLKTPEGDITAYSFAREAEERKGMDPAQITGAASSYARKYALQGLFALDDADSKDPDTQDNSMREPVSKKSISTEYVLRINNALTKAELKKVCANIKEELGKEYSKYAADHLSHYNRRLAEIEQELAQ